MPKASLPEICCNTPAYFCDAALCREKSTHYNKDLQGLFMLHQDILFLNMKHS